MSATFDWSWVFVMDQSLYTQLRNTIYSKIVPPSINNIPYDGYTITQLTFSTLQTTVTIDTSQYDTLIIVAPIKGTLTDSKGNQDQFNGKVQLTVYLYKLFIAPCPSSVTFAADDGGATWTNCLNVQPTTFSAPIVRLSQGSANTASVLTEFFQQEINEYVASSPNSLGTESSPNLPQYFAPTYQKFITLLNDPTDLRVVLQVMVNNDAPPTGDQHSEFEASQLLQIPVGSDAVIAFNDYTLYEYVAIQLENSPQSSLFTSITVTQDPAILTANLKKSNYTGKLQSQIANNAFQSSIGLSNANIANFNYVTTVALINNADGSQSVEINNDLTKSSVVVNQSNAVVISVYAIYATLVLLSPLHGVIFWSIMNTIEYYIRNAFLKFASALEFDITKDTKGKVTLTGITLNGGVVLYAEFTQLPGGTTNPGPIKVIHAPQPAVVGLDEAVEGLIKGLDAMHHGLSGGTENVS